MYPIYPKYKLRKTSKTSKLNKNGISQYLKNNKKWDKLLQTFHNYKP